ncbi:hypothetical protein NW762_013265 [Fusarium torreyae]|uniref:Ferric reductase NAD binding domain-containing protein n=1 Tax=Fusarium torreyae TaxID=1237075 RepID=A0A9W8RPE3_9HYPO|nr:hypothetical protein NW762_013265 [Fusarium torreyae]
MQPYVSNNHLLIIAGGSGAGWTLPFVEQFVASHSMVTDEERGEVLLFNNKEANNSTISDVHIQLHLTGKGAAQTATPSNGSSSALENGITRKAFESESTLPIEELDGRPDLPTTIQKVAKGMTAADSLGVYVCGPGTMQNDVRNAVAAANLDILSGSKSGGAYLHCEHFSWA